MRHSCDLTRFKHQHLVNGAHGSLMKTPVFRSCVHCLCRYFSYFQRNIICCLRRQKYLFCATLRDCLTKFAGITVWFCVSLTLRTFSRKVRKLQPDRTRVSDFWWVIVGKAPNNHVAPARSSVHHLLSASHRAMQKYIYYAHYSCNLSTPQRDVEVVRLPQEAVRFTIAWPLWPQRRLDSVLEWWGEKAINWRC